jgi:hypothetical protein
MRRRVVLLVVAPLAVAAAGALVGACGDGGSAADARNDAVVFFDAPVNAPCDYTEISDVANGTTAEVTGLTVGGAPRAICGAIDPGHPSGHVVDDDSYSFDAPAGGADVIVRMSGGGAADLAEVFVGLHDAAGDGHGYARFVVDHGVMTAHLDAGTYTLVVEAQNPTAPRAAIPYRVSLESDQPAARCPTVTAAANHVETDESASKFTADDVVYVTSNAETLTPSTADAPDDSKVVVTSGMAYRITGSSADVDVAPPSGDDYRDRDTFLISTGADTNELDLRLDWAGATNDLDLFLFPEVIGAGPPADVGRAATSSPEERQTIAVAPSSRYWLWIGGHDASKALPSIYDVSICGSHYSAR